MEREQSDAAEGDGLENTVPRGKVTRQEVPGDLHLEFKLDANPVVRSTEWGITAAKDESGKEL